MKMQPNEHRYLGDGVYASHDGYHLILKTGSHDNPDNVVSLDPYVQVLLRELLAEFVKKENSVEEGYARKFASQNQDEIGQDPICEGCGGSVSITDFRTAEALESYCCGIGNDEGFCQNCQDKKEV